MPYIPIKYKWFPGLNALRFVAAILVVLMHIHISMKQVGLPILYEIPILLKGYGAVSFFFVLSGFLITYLLLDEKDRTKNVDVKTFYWRRVFRIWPLYFLVVIFGFVFYWFILPFFGIEFRVEYPKALGVIMYGLFAANIFNSLYHVGGILNITWSIAVEEQFYLFWAPFMKLVKKRLFQIIIIAIFFFYSIAVLNGFNYFQLSDGWMAFVRSLQFHYMAVGGAGAYLLFYHHDRLLKAKIFSNKLLQLILCLLIIAYYTLYKKNFIAEILLPLPLAFLYCWLIINVSVNPKKITHFENKYTHFLGGISYGIYMLHMPVIYFVSYFTKLSPISFQGSLLYFIIFYSTVIGSTIVLAHFSNRYFENPINQYGRKWLGSNISPKLRGSVVTSFTK